ncbi:MAG: endonuclease/exonuclease/phosphatase family protein [Acidimicrobiales bacterium]
MLTIANFNMHAGVDGWGRPYDHVAVCRDLGTDVIVLEEAWAGEADPAGGQAQEIARSLGYEAVTCALAEGRRARPDPRATDRWMPRYAMLRSGRHALFLDSERPLSAEAAASARFAEAEPGSWGIAVLTRRGLAVEDTRALHLPRLARDRVRRAAIVVDLTVEGHKISVVGTHMSHLQFGSHRHYALLKKRLRSEARPDAILSGDMNLWGPPVRAFLPEWHRAVKGSTWPSRNPHSQIDHILVRGEVLVVSGEVRPDAGSDHRPVRARLTLR